MRIKIFGAQRDAIGRHIFDAGADRASDDGHGALVGACQIVGLLAGAKSDAGGDERQEAANGVAGAPAKVAFEKIAIIGRNRAGLRRRGR